MAPPSVHDGLCRANISVVLGVQIKRPLEFHTERPKPETRDLQAMTAFSFCEGGDRDVIATAASKARGNSRP